MKLPQRLLQFGTLALFSSMIGSLVLYRGGFFESAPSPRASWLAETRQDSLQPPWFDSAQFSQVLRQIVDQRIAADIRMFGSKSAPPAPPPRKKRKDKNKSLEAVILDSEIPTPYDTAVAMDILRTRYEVAHLSKQEAADFRQIYAVFQSEKKGDEDFSVMYPNYYFPGGDSSLALGKLRYGPQHLQQLSDQELFRFQSFMDTLTRQRMMGSKSGMIFISSVDTTFLIKRVKSEKRPK